MTLLDATATLVDFAKTNGRENDRVLAKAIVRVEKRLWLLQLRHAKATRTNRRKAWWAAIGALDGGMDTLREQGMCFCPKCRFRFDFGDFLKASRITGHGQVKSLICPECKSVLIGKPPEDEI